MYNVIIFQLEDSPVAIIHPVEGELIEIGKKGTPSGVPFWIVDFSVIPSDRTFRNAWTIDVEAMGKPSGYGEA